MDSPWEANLPASDLGAMEDLGLEPVGIALGTCVIKRGAMYSQRPTYGGFGQSFSPWTNGNDPYTQSWQSALGRLVAEAKAKGGHGVIGCTTDFTFIGEGMTIEVMLRGTVVRQAGKPASDIPFTTKADARQIMKLLAAGLAPRQLVFGYSYLNVSNYFTSYQMQSWANSEVTSLSQGATRCREFAINNMLTEAMRTGSHEVVDTKVGSHIYEYEVNGQVYFNFTASAIGSGVWKCGERFFDMRPLTMLRLRDNIDLDVLE